MSKLLIGAFVACVVAPHAIDAQAGTSRHEIVRGRVTADSGRPVRGASVIVTRTYVSDWPDGTGDYALAIVAVGFSRYTAHLARTSGDSILRGDARLTRSVQ